MKNYQRINADSGDDEYYTPQAIIEAARLCMGGIDLDPASSEQANRRVKAKRFFTLADDGLKQAWFGRVWMNHPFGRETNAPWIAKAIAEYQAGHTTDLICITFAATSEKWFQPLMEFPQCFLAPRTNYHLANGKVKRGVTKGSVVTYTGANLEQFARAFAGMGNIKINL